MFFYAQVSGDKNESRRRLICPQLTRCPGFRLSGPFTLLAPSNAAFNKNPDLLKTLFNPRNVDALQELFLYHIVPGFFLTEDLVPGPLQTLLGEEVDVTLNPLVFDQAGVSESDILACNGVLHVIDEVLVPPGKLDPRMLVYSWDRLISKLNTRLTNSFVVFAIFSILLQVAQSFLRFAKSSIFVP